VDERVRAGVGEIPEQAWAASVRTNGEPRKNGQVAELTGVLRENPTVGDRYRLWPTSLRLIARRERPSPGVQLSLFEQHAGFRFQVTATSRSPRRNCPPATTTSPPTCRPTRCRSSRRSPSPGPRGGDDPPREGHRASKDALGEEN